MGRKTSSWRANGRSVTAMRALARRALPRPVFDFADGAAENEFTLRRNEAAFEDVALLPRPLNGAADRDLSLTLLNHRLSMPLMVGPVGLAGLYWPDGERCLGRAAKAAGVGMCLSHGSVCTLETFADVGLNPRWMQIFIFKDKGFTHELVERAAAANYDGLVLTIDNQLLGNRERDQRNGFTIPPKLGLKGTAAMALKAGWLWRMRGELSAITFGNYVRQGEASDIGAIAGRLGEMFEPAMSWDDVGDLRQRWSGPLILKGVLHPQEARAAADHGVDAIIVSNHGGRQLDGAPGTLDILPQIAEAVGGRIPVLLDGGVRRGADVVKALALGATACLIGRPQLWGLSVAGEAGIAHVLEIYRREIDRVMGLCGMTALDQITPDMLFRYSDVRS